MNSTERYEIYERPSAKDTSRTRGFCDNIFGEAIIYVRWLLLAIVTTVQARYTPGTQTECQHREERGVDKECKHTGSREMNQEMFDTLPKRKCQQ